MSVLFSGTFSGTFTSTGQATFIPLPSGCSWMQVTNETVSYAAGANTGAEFAWRTGMPQGQGTIYVKTTATNALQIGQLAANTGFFFTDTSLPSQSAPIAYSGITGNGGANGSPLMATADTHGLPITAVAGANNPAGVVRLYGLTGALQLGGMPFTVANVVNNTSMDLIYMQSIATTATAGTYRVIQYNPIYYPSFRYITNITKATQAVVTMSVTHNYLPGQKIRFVIPEVTATYFGMTELNGVLATIVAVNTVANTITVDVDTSAFTTFAFPLTTTGKFSPALVVPVGQNMAESIELNVNYSSDATVNVSQIGMLLQAGTLSPAGVTGNIISWIAGKSFNQ